jgi:hypothetical protein
MDVRRWSATDLELEASADGIILRQNGSAYLAREWALTEQVDSFVEACVDAGLGCFIRHSHPKVSNRANGVHYLCASRAADERWVVGIDQYSPKARKTGDQIQRLIVENHYGFALQRAGLRIDWQSSSANNIHVPFSELAHLLTVLAPVVDDVEKNLGTKRWEEIKSRIGFVTEAVLESWMLATWDTLPFAHEISLVGNQINRVDIVGRTRLGERVLFELKRKPADLATLAQISGYLARDDAGSVPAARPAWGAIVAPAFTSDLVAMVATRPNPLALWRYVEHDGLVALVLEASSWPVRAHEALSVSHARSQALKGAPK